MLLPSSGGALRSHAVRHDLRRFVVAAVIAFALAMLAVMALPATAGELELRLDGGSTSAPASAATPPAAGEPAWLRDPLASPLAELRTP